MLRPRPESLRAHRAVRACSKYSASSSTRFVAGDSLCVGKSCEAKIALEGWQLLERPPAFWLPSWLAG